MSSNRFRVLRAVLRNAVLWGAAWAAVMGAFFAVVVLVDPSPGLESPVDRVGTALLVGIRWAVRFGLAGAVAGTAFSLAVRLGFRGRRLADISPLRFAMLGAVVGGVGVPLYLQAMNVLFGDGPIPWRLVMAPGAAVLGAAAAAGSILVARRAASHHAPDPDPLEQVDDVHTLPGAGPPEPSRSQRSRSAPL
jgi:hypothetical protein